MILLTPGPTPIHPRVQEALARPMRGHLDPEVLLCNRNIRSLLQTLFDAGEGALVAALAGSGSLAMEAGFANLVSRGDAVLVLANGSFGERMAEMARVYGLEAGILHFPPNAPVDPAQVREALSRKAYRLVAMVHGETSTGVINPASEIAALAREHGALFMLDVVTTAAMLPFSMQKLGVDYAFTGSQKCLSAPPGLAPFGLSARARASLTGAQSWYTDFRRVEQYWEKEGYHCTAPVLLHFALEEALRLALEEGLEARHQRAQELYAATLAVLEETGFSAYAPKEARLPTVLVVRPPANLSEAEIRRGLYCQGIAVAGGIGPTAGQVLRLGLMGEAARRENFSAFFRALGKTLGVTGLDLAFEERLTAATAS